MAILNYRHVQNRLAELILQSAFKVHKNLGPGLLESAYSYCLYHELKKLGLKVERNLKLPFKYQETHMDLDFQIDIMVEGKIVLLTKSVDQLSDLHSAELQTHLVVAECEVGFLLNFNVSTLKNGVRRIINRNDTHCNLAVS